MERKAREFIVAFILSASDPHAFVPLVFRLPTISLCTKQSRFVDHLSSFALGQLPFYLSGRPHVCHVPTLFAVRQPLVLSSSFFILEHCSSLNALLFSHTTVATEPPD